MKSFASYEKFLEKSAQTPPDWKYIEPHARKSVKFKKAIRDC